MTIRHDLKTYLQAHYAVVELTSSDKVLISDQNARVDFMTTHYAPDQIGMENADPKKDGVLSLQITAFSAFTAEDVMTALEYVNKHATSKMKRPFSRVDIKIFQSAIDGVGLPDTAPLTTMLTGAGFVKNLDGTKWERSQPFTYVKK